MNDNPNKFVGYRLGVPDREAARIGELIANGNLGSRMRSSSELAVQRQDYHWGSLYYSFTPFDIIYRAVGHDGKEITRGSLEFPTLGEKTSNGTVLIVANRVASLVERLNQPNSPSQNGSSEVF